MLCTKHAQKMLNKSKGQLFFNKNSGFLGSLLCRMRFEWSDDIDTAATNGETLYWNPEFFLSLDEETRVTVLAHELWHVAYLHPVRGEGLDQETYNIAADHVINLMLSQHGYYMNGFPYVMDPKYIGWSTDKVYADLIQNPPPPKSNPQGGLGSDIQKPVTDDGQVSSTTMADMVSKVVGAATAARMSGQAGSIPGEVSQTYENFLKPKLSWETILHNFFNEMVDFDYSYRRPNRRYEDPIMKGLVGMTGLEHLVYYLDISGSVSDEDILRFNSEVSFIKEEFNPQRLTLVTFDTEIKDIYEFDQNDEFKRIVVTGRGGTNLNPVMAHANELNPNAIIIFTDLHVSIPSDEPKVPLIWICVDNPKAEVPYGKLIHLD